MESQLTFEMMDSRGVAARRFPFSAAAGCIRGEGPYAAVTKCFKRWKVFLYQSDGQRAAKLQDWSDRGCSPDCKSEHCAVDLI